MTRPPLHDDLSRFNLRRLASIQRLPDAARQEDGVIQA